jgi:hypothetical protein
MMTPMEAAKLMLVVNAIAFIVLFAFPKSKPHRPFVVMLMAWITFVMIGKNWLRMKGWQTTSELLGASGPLPLLPYLWYHKIKAKRMSA